MLTHLGNYELLRPLGTGGMAQTFIAKRRGPAGFEQTVCLKRVLPEYANDAALIEQFLDEARLVAHLRHANIVQVYDFGEADGSYFMALELVDGVDLHTLTKFLRAEQITLPAPLALYIATELLKALDYAHNARIEDEPLNLVHRDVSPSNVLLSRHAEVKLADFGIARSRQRRHKTQAGRTKGKVAYMSPEQVRGDDLDGRSDLFAVGIVLHELLTSVHPFDAPTDITLLSNILSGTRTRLNSLTPALGPELVGLLDTLLAVEVDQRPASAAEALALMPSLEQPFKITRELAGLVRTCFESSTRSAPPPLPRSPSANVERPTAPLASSSSRTPVAPTGATANTPTRDEPSPPRAEVMSTDAMRTASRATRNRWRLIAMVVTLSFSVAGVSWFLLRRPDATTTSPEPALEHRAPHEGSSGQGARTTQEATAPAASKPAATRREGPLKEDSSPPGHSVVESAPQEESPPELQAPKAPDVEDAPQPAAGAQAKKVSNQGKEHRAAGERSRRAPPPVSPTRAPEPSRSGAGSEPALPRSPSRAGVDFQPNEF